MPKRVLVACEFSGTVRDACIRLGHDAVSCDLLPTEVPGPHIQGDVRDFLNQGWDVMIAHPPCRFLARSGLYWRSLRHPMDEAAAFRFVLDLWEAPIPSIAIENPIGVLSSQFKTPTQVVHPYEYGQPFSKATCLWLKNLPRLVPTTIVKPAFDIYDLTSSGDLKWASRSRTFQAIAESMAYQWLGDARGAGGMSTP